MPEWPLDPRLLRTRPVDEIPLPDPQGWRVSQRGNTYTVLSGYLLIVKQSPETGRWRCSVRPDNDDEARWETSGYILPSEVDAKTWGLNKIGYRPPPPDPPPGRPQRTPVLEPPRRRRIRLDLDPE